jgi:hypothetical protein
VLRGRTGDARVSERIAQRDGIDPRRAEQLEGRLGPAPHADVRALDERDAGIEQHGVGPGEVR